MKSNIEVGWVGMGGGRSSPPNPNLMNDDVIFSTLIFLLSVSTIAVRQGAVWSNVTLPAEWGEVYNQGWHCGCYRLYGHSAQGQGPLPEPARTNPNRTIQLPSSTV